MSMRKASRLAAILILAGLPWTTGVEEVRSQGAPLPAAIATLRIEAGDGEYLAWADNRLAGPIEVILRAGAGGDVSVFGFASAAGAGGKGTPAASACVATAAAGASCA